MIVSRIDAHAAQEVERRCRLKIDAALVTGDCLLGLWLCWDTGFAPWHWQFWICFGPLFIAVEMIARVVGSATSNEDCELES